MEVDHTRLLYRHDSGVVVHTLDHFTLYHLSLHRKGRSLCATRRNTRLVFFGVPTLFLRVFGIVGFVMFLRMYYTFWVKMECHDLSEHKNGEEQQHHQPNGHAPVKRSKKD